MTELVKLSSDQHKTLKADLDARVRFASSQHVLALRASEVGRAVTCFPVFFSKSQRTGDWAVSAVTSITPGTNLFVEDSKWTATYEPTILQIYSFYLMESDTDKGYSVGIDTGSDAFSEDHGEALFDDKGQPSLYLSKVTGLLESDVQNNVQTQLFTKRVAELGLVQELNLVVHFENGESQTITGLSCVNEDRLQSLSSEELNELHKNGYLVALHGMLLSIFQVNVLINRHNQSNPQNPIKQIKLEVGRDATTAY